VITPGLTEEEQQRLRSSAAELEKILETGEER
jgi:hypothetical protein